MNKHALLSASSAHRWLVCTPSARLCEGIKGESSVAAEEGTLAHTVAELKLLKQFDKVEKLRIDKEMDEHTDNYVQWARELIDSKKTKAHGIESRISYTDFAPGGFGTCDLWALQDNGLHIADLKYGRTYVETSDNPQLLLYALGVCEKIGHLYDIKTIHMHIYQPRINNIKTSVITSTDLYKWATDVLRPQAEKAYRGIGDIVPGSHCKYCKMAGKCKAQARRLLELMPYTDKDLHTLQGDELRDALDKAAELALWADKLKAYAKTQLEFEGKEVPGYKLHKTAGRRYITDEGTERLEAAGVNPYEKPKLKSVSAIEKEIGKAETSSILDGCIEYGAEITKLMKEKGED